ncbi:signal peptidase I [Dehalobacter sp. DCM]|uniref:signal peptidase I n=1 Tax=Dehalobacter sp. DCM TaxID=2907827 RepID=UPI00308182AA|nr:signal peptidase I [Dehalobacter sp. DCM]
MKGFMKSLFEWVIIIAVAFALSLVIRNFLIDTRIVPTGSMLPTIQLEDRLIVDRFFYKYGDIQRGDIIVFEAPDEIMKDEDLVKRVIGLPGETIQVTNSKVYINGQVLDEPYVESSANYEFGPYTIPEGTFFMMGDNRPISYDSHRWGALDGEKIIGKVWVRYWPFDRLGPLTKLPEDYLPGAVESP